MGSGRRGRRRARIFLRPHLIASGHLPRHRSVLQQGLARGAGDRGALSHAGDESSRMETDILLLGKARAQGNPSKGMAMRTNRASWVFAVSLSRVLGSLLIVGIAAVSVGCREATQAAAEAPPTVEIEPVAEKDM